ncbi:MAG TPA: hypothetical protein VJP87_12945 [Candidatus Acidoferrales bacterium]|nr:hypothetical protein [Candidatus Acidoferrales bacterium]
MKRNIFVVAVAALSLALGGCSPLKFLFPLYTDSDQLFDGNLVGEWRYLPDKSGDDGVSTEDENENARWVFQKTKDKLTYDSWQIELGKAGGLRSAAKLVKLGDAQFLDFESFSDFSEDQQSPYPAISAHAVARVWISKERVTIRVLDEKWARKQIALKKFPLAFLETPTDLAVTAKTEEMRQFVAQHADDKEAFSLNFDLARVH